MKSSAREPVYCLRPRLPAGKPVVLGLTAVSVRFVQLASIHSLQCPPARTGPGRPLVCSVRACRPSPVRSGPVRSGRPAAVRSPAGFPAAAKAGRRRSGWKSLRPALSPSLSRPRRRPRGGPRRRRPRGAARSAPSGGARRLRDVCVGGGAAAVARSEKCSALADSRLSWVFGEGACAADHCVSTNNDRDLVRRN